MTVLGASAYVVTRQSAPADPLDVIDGATGLPATPTTTTLTIMASVQPMPGERRELLPDGVRLSDARLVLTETAINGPDNDAGTDSDTLAIGGDTYRVIEVEHYDAIIPHYEAVAVRVRS